MKIIKSFRSKGIKVTEIHNWNQYLRDNWIEQFAGFLSEEEKKEIYLDDFLWHLFSYRKVKCFEHDQSKVIFNNEIKSSVYIFYQHSDYAFIIEDTQEVQAEEFDNEDDIYIVDREFSWTYVKTHESECGPYFYKRNHKELK